MAKVRQDAWSEEDDLLLADTVLRHIREGGTQLQAFDEVGDKLNRTSAACGFRWNAIVRNRYQQAIEIAKKQRKERKRMLSRQMNKETVQRTVSQQPTQASEPVQVQQNHNDSAEMTLNDVISYLQKLQIDGQSSEGWKIETARLKRENDHLQTENENLKKQLNRLSKEHETVKEDYQSLIQIMDRARKMVVFQEEEKNTPSFRMDKNGNLEKIAK
ncbi:MAG TPA: RsfA family transcriptional regulator [Bacillales bacterium]|nr:RsfA family transcriptional regulator [Bacillales bacterium]